MKNERQKKKKIKIDMNKDVELLPTSFFVGKYFIQKKKEDEEA